MVVGVVQPGISVIGVVSHEFIAGMLHTNLVSASQLMSYQFSSGFTTTQFCSVLFPVDQLGLVISQDAEAFHSLFVENSDAVACNKV